MAIMDAAPRRRLKRIERAAVAGVMRREIINFGSYWRSATFSSTVEPTVYLLAFGLGMPATGFHNLTGLPGATTQIDSAALT